MIMLPAEGSSPIPQNWNLARFSVNDGVILPPDIRGRVVWGPRRSKVVSQHMFPHRTAAVGDTVFAVLPV